MKVKCMILLWFYIITFDLVMQHFIFIFYHMNLHPPVLYMISYNIYQLLKRPCRNGRASSFNIFFSTSNVPCMTVFSSLFFFIWNNPECLPDCTGVVTPACYYNRSFANLPVIPVRYFVRSAV